MVTFEILKQQLIALDQVQGITPVDILTLPGAVQSSMRKMLKVAMPLGALATDLHLTLDEARQIGDLLVGKGYLRSEESADGSGTLYRVRFARMRTHDIPLDL